MTEVGERVRGSLVGFLHAAVADERKFFAGHLTFWWPEATC